jgi:hypothetical protein
MTCDMHGVDRIYCSYLHTIHSPTQQLDPDKIPIEVVWAGELAMHEHLGHTEDWLICSEPVCDGNTAGICIQEGVKQWIASLKRP